MRSFESSNILIRLAKTEKDYKEIYRLRYFDLILNYNKEQVSHEEIDKDEYDDVCDHLVAIDTIKNEVIGTYRLIKRSHITKLGQYLTENEFDISSLNNYEVLEVGRAVVKEEYRDGVAISLLWKGVIRYALEENVDFMIGTASFHGVDPLEYKDTLSYLYYNHLSPEDIRCHVRETTFSKLNLLEENEIDEELAKKKMPPLVKGYLRLGATIGDGAYLDIPFNSLDVLIVLKIKDINPRYLKRYLE